MEWMLMPLRRYADFSGRSRRKEYWMFILLILIVGVVLGWMTGSFTTASDPADSFEMATWSSSSILLSVFYLAIIIPSLAVQVRRFHDQDKSGWLVLLNFIPLVGGLIVLVFMCLEGTRGDNRFGPDPKAGENIKDVFN
ncbi:MAG: DUF805 domain-containing protein [Parasphingorhabdus sp.]